MADTLNFEIISLNVRGMQESSRKTKVIHISKKVIVHLVYFHAARLIASKLLKNRGKEISKQDTLAQVFLTDQTTLTRPKLHLEITVSIKLSQSI